MTMEPVHPIDIEWRDGLITIVVLLAVIIGAQYLLGHWDQVLAKAIDCFPLCWPWGG